MTLEANGKQDKVNIKHVRCYDYVNSVKSYLPIWSVLPRKKTLIKAAMAIPTGLNMVTNTGPFLLMHQVNTENVTTLPKVACNIVFHIGMSFAKKKKTLIHNLLSQQYMLTE